MTYIPDTYSGSEKINRFYGKTFPSNENRNIRSVKISEISSPSASNHCITLGRVLPEDQRAYSQKTLALAATAIILFAVAAAILIYGLVKNDRNIAIVSGVLFIVWSFIALAWSERAKNEYTGHSDICN